MESTKKNFKQWLKDLDKKQVLSVTANVLIWAFVAFSLLITILVFSAQGSKDGVPSVFGKSLISISTDSMEGTFDVGDLVLMTKITDKEKESLVAGQIITFHAPIDIDGDGIIGDLNTHRIYEVDHDRRTFVTKGDHNPHPDNVGTDGYVVHYSDVIGICEEDDCFSGLGGVIAFLRSSLGFFLCIVCPLILFFLYELYNFITIVVTERTKKTIAAANAAPVVDEEEIKRRAVEEYLAKQRDEEAIKKRAIEEYLAAQKAQEAKEENNSENAENK